MQENKKELEKFSKPIILLACFFASLSSIFIKAGNAPSVVLVFYRVTMATLMLLPFVLITSRKELVSIPKKYLLLSIASGITLGIHFFCYFTSLTMTSIASAVVIVNAEVFFVSIAMFLFFRERISAFGWLGIAVSFIGSVVIAMADAGAGGDNLVGDLFAFLGAFAMAVYTMIGRACRESVSTTVYTFIVYAAASVTTFLMTLFSGTAVFGYEPKNFLVAFALAVFCTILGHSIFSWGLKYEAPSFISMGKLSEPIFAAVMGIFIYSEIPSFGVILGGAAVIIGLFIYTKLGEVRKSQS